ncbi:hypothetical protein LJK88_43660 [Paenibacillus sp. P26]|nr:hypothetical protein LJK88_43660 [Paenibacillus sp. P26]
MEAFASRWSIPVATTPGGKGVIRSDHPLHLGPYGLGGNALTEAYLREGVDLMIVVGDQLSDLEIPGLSPALYPKHMVHFDYAPRFIGKALPIPTTAVLGSIRSNLQALLKYTSPRTAARDIPVVIESEPAYEPTGYLRGKEVMEVLREELPPDTLVYGDAGVPLVLCDQIF